jgi:hypothetical protein
VLSYPVFNRFYCKVFLTDALEYVGGAAATCMIDNTHVVVATGTGARMVPAPEMAAFADRFGFLFRAHEKGNANRSARVERPLSVKRIDMRSENRTVVKAIALASG